MATPQLSPGVLVREVDLTVGRAENVLDNIGAIAGPFEIGPVDEAIDISTETQLINTFGKPISTDAQYEYWMSASSFLTYGGVLKVVRTDDAQLNNANGDRNGNVDTSLKIKNYDDFVANYSDDTQTWGLAAKNPGSWANNLKVCMIDNLADQTLAIGSTTGVTVGMGVSTSLTNQVIAGSGDTSSFTGHLKGIITGIGETTIDVRITQRETTAGVSTNVTYAQGDQARSFKAGNEITIVNSSTVGIATTTLGTAVGEVIDWYDSQTLGLTNSTVFWSSIAPRPTTTTYASDRSSRNDAIHVVVIDDLGTVTGIQGNLLEKNLNLSKAKDAISAENAPQKIYYKDFLADFSEYVYAGDDPSDGSDGFVAASDFSSGYTPITTAAGGWSRDAQGIVFNVIGNATYTLTGGIDYSATGGMTATLGNLITSYNLFKNKDEIAVDYLIMGPGLGNKEDSQAKAGRLISIAGARKDCMAVISPHRADVVNITNTDTQTDNIIEFYSPLASSSYAVFDTGYKYTFDRFNNKFRFIPTNADVAGLMVRTSINSFPWFSPAGQQRGILNNAIKLAYNPDKAQRDQLYPLRINSIVNQPGTGILLFGDKTGLGFASAFDRINVRRLFLTIEQSLQKAAEAQLFELNDQVTRANFVNIVEPFLRDVEAKRGLNGFLVICDETNNTPDVIDNNEFRADIFLKPARSINFVTLTFVATRTGVSFEEVAGRV
tara:strand:+ start:1754 stop:3910 length:2157 start_codon:yes stop_codon:yes gene_type:complete